MNRDLDSFKSAQMRSIEKEHHAGKTIKELADKWGVTREVIAAVLERRAVIRRLHSTAQREKENAEVSIYWHGEIYP